MLCEFWAETNHFFYVNEIFNEIGHELLQIRSELCFAQAQSFNHSFVPG